MIDFDEVIDCVVVGLEWRFCVIILCEKEIVVYFEVGDVFVVEFWLYVDCVSMVLIILCGVVVFGYM